MAIKGELVGKYITGEDVAMQECGVILHQPTIKEILQTGEDNFLLAVQFFTESETYINQLRQGNFELIDVPDFQILLVMYMNDPELQKVLNTFFDLVFPLYNVVFTENSIDFKNEDDIVRGRVTPFNFSEMQNTLKQLFVPYTQQKEDYNPANEAAEEIARKIKEGKARINQQNEEKEGSQSLFASFCSILSIGLHLDINVLLSYTPFQLFDSYMRFDRKEVEDRYIKMATTPFADVSSLEQPDSWVSNFYN